MPVFGQSDAMLATQTTPDVETIKLRVDLLSLAKRETHLKKVSSSGGGEYAGSCPFCGGLDRFRVQPCREDGGKWFCRGCGGGKWNDAIDFIMRRDNCDFPAALEACTRLAGVSIPGKPKLPELDRRKWQEKIIPFIDECTQALMEKTGERARGYLENRGVTVETAVSWGLGLNLADRYDPVEEWGFSDGSGFWLPRGITIPCYYRGDFHYVNVRRPVGDPKYFKLRGSKGWIFGAKDFANYPYLYVFESELDALLAWQEARKAGFAIAAGSFPAGNTFHPGWMVDLEGFEGFIVCHDADEEGRKHGARLAGLSKNIVGVEVPRGKDLTEFFQSGGSVVEFLVDALDALKGAA